MTCKIELFEIELWNMRMTVIPIVMSAQFSQMWKGDWNSWKLEDKSRTFHWRIFWIRQNKSWRLQWKLEKGKTTTIVILRGIKFFRILLYTQIT